MRAWIEIPYTCRSKKSKRVALFMRAWIEILYSLSVITSHPVALFMRAWIEIVKSMFIPPFCAMSPSLRGRGLK